MGTMEAVVATLRAVARKVEEHPAAKIEHISTWRYLRSKTLLLLLAYVFPK
jgi:hypothetical protein